MPYIIQYRPRVAKDLKMLPKDQQGKILIKIEEMKQGFVGDVKKLADDKHGYRLRVGDYRVLFDLFGEHIIVRRIAHRREAYDL